MSSLYRYCKFCSSYKYTTHSTEQHKCSRCKKYGHSKKQCTTSDYDIFMTEYKYKMREKTPLTTKIIIGEYTLHRDYEFKTASIYTDGIELFIDKKVFEGYTTDGYYPKPGIFKEVYEMLLSGKIDKYFLYEQGGRGTTDTPRYCIYTAKSLSEMEL